jgi:hypothetical protein
LEELIAVGKRVPEASDSVVVPTAYNFTKWFKPCMNPGFGGFVGNGAAHGNVHYWSIERDTDPKSKIWDPVAQVWRWNAIWRYKMRVGFAGDFLPREGKVHVLHKLPSTDA